MKLPHPSQFTSGGAGYVLSLDPGVTTLGWSLWFSDSFTVKEMPHTSGGIVLSREDRKLSWCRQVEKLVSELRGEIERADADLAYNVTAIVSEFPQLWSGSQVSHAAGVRGDLLHIAACVGWIRGCALNADLYTVTPNEWKGQLSKRQTRTRVQRILDRYLPTETTSHEIDAIAIGLHAKGFGMNCQRARGR